MNRFGEAVVAPWWAELPSLLDALAHAWSLELGEPAPEGHTSLVLWTNRGVLKVSPEPGVAGFERDGLTAFAASGRVPRVLESEEERGALLLTAVGGGTPAMRAEAPPPLAEIAALLGALRAAAPVPGPDLEPLHVRVRTVLEHWIGRRERDARMAAAVPDRAIPDAIERAAALARSAPETALLHGDLHPGNVLVSEGGLVAIDPRPCAGDPAYDAADWVLFRAAPGSWRRRAEALGAAVGVGGDRVMAWCSAFGALHAASAASRGAAPARVAALLAL